MIACAKCNKTVSSVVHVDDNTITVPSREYYCSAKCGKASGKKCNKTIPLEGGACGTIIMGKKDEYRFCGNTANCPKHAHLRKENEDNKFIAGTSDKKVSKQEPVNDKKASKASKSGESDTQSSTKYLSVKTSKLLETEECSSSKKNKKKTASKASSSVFEEDTSHDAISTHALYGKRITFSGFRSDELKEKIESKNVGGTVTTCVSRRTDYLVYTEKKNGEISTKMKEAADMPTIMVIPKEMFCTIFFGAEK